jgi:hypothetical protein
MHGYPQRQRELAPDHLAAARREVVATAGTEGVHDEQPPPALIQWAGLPDEGRIQARVTDLDDDAVPGPPYGKLDGGRPGPRDRTARGLRGSHRVGDQLGGQQLRRGGEVSKLPRPEQLADMAPGYGDGRRLGRQPERAVRRSRFRHRIGPSGGGQPGRDRHHLLRHRFADHGREGHPLPHRVSGWWRGRRCGSADL